VVITGGVPGLVGLWHCARLRLGLVARLTALVPSRLPHQPGGKRRRWVRGHEDDGLIGYWVGQFIAHARRLGGFPHCQRCERRVQPCDERSGPEWLWPRLSGRVQPDIGITYEFVATLLFVIVILGSTRKLLLQDSPVLQSPYPRRDPPARRPHHRDQRESSAKALDLQSSSAVSHSTAWYFCSYPL